MAAFLTIRDSVREFLRKYDEITTPIFKFFASLIMFFSINSMFGYSDLFDRGIVIFLLSVICALVSGPVSVLVAGVVIFVNCMTVAKDIGVLFLIGFILVYCLYMRMFPKSAYILALVPVMCVCHMYYAIPLVVAIFAGVTGIVPAAFGIIVYKFADYVNEAKGMIGTATNAEEEEFQAYSYIIEQLTKDKTMLLGIIVFAVVILVAYIVYRLPVDYTWYISIAAGALCNIILFLICGSVMDVTVSIGMVFLGSIIGAIIALVVQVCKSIVDYSKKEVVQFEDDDYYYYVKAIPKLSVGTKKKNVKKMTQ